MQIHFEASQFAVVLRENNDLLGYCGFMHHPEVPDDVRAEMDLEERRLGIVREKQPLPEMIPEDVRSELDHEARLAAEKMHMQLTEGQEPPVDDEE